MLSQALIDQFQEEGYVVIDNLLTETELDRYQPIVRAAVSSRKRFDTRALAQKSAYEQSFLQCMNLWEDFPEIRPLTFHQNIAQAAAALLQASVVRLWHDQALFKEQGGRVTDPHQDLPYWPMAEEDALTAWIPFDGSTRENGCMYYIPGSHKVADRTFVDIFRRGDEDPMDQAKDLLTAEPVHVEVPRGSVAFHHGLTAHGANANRSTQTREVHTMIYFKDGTKRSATGKHHAVDRSGIKPGSAITSDVTPIACPREDLPQPPPPLRINRALALTGAFPQSTELD